MVFYQVVGGLGVDNITELSFRKNLTVHLSTIQNYLLL